MITNFELRNILIKAAGQSFEVLINEVMSNCDAPYSNKSYVALHISMLNNLSNEEYLNSLKDHSLYIDGNSIAIIARKMSISPIFLVPTTDLVPAIFEFASKTRRVFTVGVIGGDGANLKRLRQSIEKFQNIKVIFGLAGYPSTWNDEEISSLTSEVDLLLIGMGVPLESIFLAENIESFKAHSILTCGGLFGFMIGDETRAPLIFRISKMEWMWRMMHDPRRLASRYLKGLLKLLFISLKR